MLRPSVETERLSTVQRAARHVLGKGSSDFGSMEIFPPEVPKALTGSTEYIWRSQIAWAWWKAGYLSCKIIGRGIGKHRSYQLLVPGREALERIAEDPVIASFYVKAKRNTTSESYPAEWFQPEALRAPLKEEEAEEEAEEESTDDQEGSSLVSEDRTGSSEDRERERSASIEVERDRRWDLMIGVLEKVSTQFGDLKAEITTLKAEVKAQSDFVLEVAQRIETSSQPSVTREDLARVSAEIAQAIISEKTKDKTKGADLLEAVRALHEKVLEQERSGEKLSTSLSTSIATIGAGVLELGTEVALLTKRGKSHEELEVFIAGRLQQLADDLRGDQEDLIEAAVGTLDKRLGGLDKRVTAAAGKTPDLSAFKEDLASLREDLSGVKEDFSGVREDVESLLESIDEIDEGFISRLEEYKKQGTATNETFMRVTEGVQDILRATRAVCSGMVEIAMQRGLTAGGSPEEIRRKAEGMIDNVEAASNAIKGRVSSLGGGLIKNAAFADVVEGEGAKIIKGMTFVEGDKKDVKKEAES